MAVVLTIRVKKNRPPDQRRPINLTREFRVLLKVEPNTRAYEVLLQIAILSSIDLGAGINEEVIFDKSAELGVPIVI